MAKKQKSQSPPNELDNLEKELSAIPLSDKPSLVDIPPPSDEIKKAGRPRGSKSSKSTLDLNQQMILEILKSQKTQIVNNLVISPVNGIKEYCKTRRPDLTEQIETIWTISESEKLQVQFWSNIMFDLYLPDLVKHLKLIALIAGSLSILSLYAPRILASISLNKTKPIVKNEPSKPVVT